MTKDRAGRPYKPPTAAYVARMVGGGTRRSHPEARPPPFPKNRLLRVSAPEPVKRHSALHTHPGIFPPLLLGLLQLGAFLRLLHPFGLGLDE